MVALKPQFKLHSVALTHHAVVTGARRLCFGEVLLMRRHILRKVNAFYRDEPDPGIYQDVLSVITVLSSFWTHS